LRRQEVQTWKKVIRVISHELNNSLAPLTSLAHSGAELVRRGQTERLPQILQTIGERTRHLESFILGYARFAKLPTPRLEACPGRPSSRAWRPRCSSSLARRAAGGAGPHRRRPDGTGAAQPAEERPRIGLAPEDVELQCAACRTCCASKCWTAAAA
jgi:hypothetical protein